MEDLFLPPIIIFLVVVAPIWLVLHYRSKRQISQGLSEEEYLQLAQLSELADEMTERIHTLESILDAESPGWRNKR